MQTVDMPVMTDPTSFPLPMLNAGEAACVSRILPCGQGLARKLTAMGLSPGAKVTVLNGRGGPLLLRVGECRIAVGLGMAQRVMVKLCKT